MRRFGVSEGGCGRCSRGEFAVLRPFRGEGRKRLQPVPRGADFAVRGCCVCMAGVCDGQERLRFAKGGVHFALRGLRVYSNRKRFQVSGRSLRRARTKRSGLRALRRREAAARAAPLVPVIPTVFLRASVNPCVCLYGIGRRSRQLRSLVAGLCGPLRASAGLCGAKTAARRPNAAPTAGAAGATPDRGPQRADPADRSPVAAISAGMPLPCACIIAGADAAFRRYFRRNTVAVREVL